MRERQRLAAIAAFIIMAAWVRAASADEAAGGPEVLSVPAVTVYPGDVITDAMLGDQGFPAGTANAAIVAARRDLVGKIARRTLMPGKPVAANAIAEPDLVKRGTIVRAFLQDD